MDNTQVPRQGRPQEELFMRPKTPPDTIQPLRIAKQATSPGPVSVLYTAPNPSTPSRRAPYPDDPSFERSARRDAHPATSSPKPIPNTRQYASPPREAYGNHAYPTPGSRGASPPQFRVQQASPPRSGSAFAQYASQAEPAIRVLRPGERNPFPQKPLPESPGPDLPDKEGIYYDGQEQDQQQEHQQNSHQMFHARDEIQEGTLEPQSAATEFARQYYGAPPTEGQGNGERAQYGNNLGVPNQQGVNRLASTASVSTTKASRGSPPPPETPVGTYAGEHVYAVYPVPSNNVPETRSLSSAYAQQNQQYGGPQQTQSQQSQDRIYSPPPSSISDQPQYQAMQGYPPTHNQQQLPGTTYQTNDLPNRTTQMTPSRPTQLQYQSPPQDFPGSPIESEMQRLRIGEEAPPAYASVSQPTGQGYPAEKPNTSQRPSDGQAGAGFSPNLQNHPAFANGYINQPPTQVGSPTPSQAATLAGSVAPQIQPTPSPAPSQSTPPPLPEGWIAHLDPNSGHYYYIHLPTQSTQWEYPKGPTPLALNDSLSTTGTYMGSVATPTQSTFNFAKPMASPGFQSPDPFYRQSMLSMSSMSMSSPTAAGFTQPPPMFGVEVYRIAPTNGVYFGPYLRYTNMDVDNGVWYGSIMLITDVPHPPTIHIHQSIDLSPNPRQLKANPIHEHQRWTFYRYDIDLRMEETHEARWTYAITSHLGCTRYEFIVASRHETSWRFIAHSSNDFAINIGTNERFRLGGVGYMWRDILQKHQDVGGFHVQLGMGNQVFADRLWREVPALKQWTAMSGKEARKNVQWTKQLEEEVTHAYFHYYTSHFDQTPLREAWAQIPHIMALDDHEIFDGYGSYPPHLQQSHIFRNIGRIALQTYLVFQHHTTPSLLSTSTSLSTTNTFDLFTITGTGFHTLKYLGPALVVCAPDCRSERTQTQVLAGPTWQGLFPKIALLPPSVQHCIWLVPVPVIYPRFSTAESLAQTMAQGKKAVTTTFNALGKVTSSVAGLAGSSAKSAVGEGFSSIKKAVGKSGLMSSVLSPFGELDILDEFRDAWTHESKDLERTYFIRTLQGIAQQKSLRMTFLSGGAAGCAAAGLVHDPGVVAGGHKTMYQIVSSSVVNAPPNPYVLKMLHPSGSSNSSGNGGGSGGGGGGGEKPLYVPQNGQRSGAAGGGVTDTKEDMLDVFSVDVNGGAREGVARRLMGRRNYVSVVAFDAEAVREGFAVASGGGGQLQQQQQQQQQYAGLTSEQIEYQQQQQQQQQQNLQQRNSSYSSHSQRPLGRLSLAIDFMVQSDAAQAGSGAPMTLKYGPVVVPPVEYGR